MGYSVETGFFKEMWRLNWPQGGGRSKLAISAHLSAQILSVFKKERKQYLIPIPFGSGGSSNKISGAEMKGRWAFEGRK